MTDRFASFAHTGPGRALIKRLGLPAPPRLRRYQPGDPVALGPVIVAAAPGARLLDGVRKLLDAAGVAVRDPDSGVADAAAAPTDGAALLFDATGIARSTDLRALYDFF